MGFEPNREAAERMVEQIFPRVLAQRPEAKLILVGKDSDTLASRAARPNGVEYLGFVSDLDAVIGRSAVFVCPMVNGGGTRIKLLDAAAYALPIVSTAMGAEGIDFVDGRDCLLRNTDQAFAEACIDLLDNRVRGRELGIAARSLIEANYQASAVEAQLAALFAHRPP